MLVRPSWSVKSLLPDNAAHETVHTIPAEQLHHLLRLSALPQPTSHEQEDHMIRTLESQIHFVREIQRVDTTGVEPLHSIRDESPDALKETTIGLGHLQDAMSKELVVGRFRRIHRQASEKNARPDGPTWDGNALGHALKTTGKFLCVEIAN